MDPDYFPPARMREIINYLHTHDQRYGMFLKCTNGVTHAMT